ncbi:replication factor c subunit 3 [Nicotiana attenuata]|uniref:Replication factor c subunit 3 n=1 Tax=Nicotiana attenuata TaxID=49451 RepID=A0A1J6J848_NICAT|nr:replication factor c subunit 3 [Nicotiana attenuata]
MDSQELRIHIADPNLLGSEGVVAFEKTNPSFCASMPLICLSTLRNLIFKSRWKWIFEAGPRTIDVELTTLSSTNHVELSPSDAGFQDRYVVQEIIKEMAKNRPIDTKGKKGFKGDSTALSFDSNPGRSCRSSEF